MYIVTIAVIIIMAIQCIKERGGTLRPKSKFPLRETNQTRNVSIADRWFNNPACLLIKPVRAGTLTRRARITPLSFLGKDPARTTPNFKQTRDNPVESSQSESIRS